MQTNTRVCIDKVVKRPEDPFSHVRESVTYRKSRNVVNGATSEKKINSYCYKNMLTMLSVNNGKITKFSFTDCLLIKFNINFKIL